MPRRAWSRRTETLINVDAVIHSDRDHIPGDLTELFLRYPHTLRSNQFAQDRSRQGWVGGDLGHSDLDESLPGINFHVLDRDDVRHGREPRFVGSHRVSIHQ